MLDYGLCFGGSIVLFVYASAGACDPIKKVAVSEESGELNNGWGNPSMLVRGHPFLDL